MSKAIYINPVFGADNNSNGRGLKQRNGLSNTRRIYTDEFLPQRKDASTQLDREIELDLDVSQGEVNVRKRLLCPCQTRNDNVTLKELVQYYHESATIHGIARLKDKQFYIFRRPLWLLLVLVMTIMLAWTLYNQMVQLSENPVKTVTSVSLNTDLAFPAVTLCNLNQFIRDRVPDIPLIKQMLYSQSEFSGLAQRFNNRTFPSDLDDYPDVPGPEVKRMLHAAAPRLEDFLLQCTWRLDVLPCKELFKPVETNLGICFTFNGASETIERRRASLNWSSLRVLVDTQNDKSYFSKFMSAGIKVLVHEPGEVPYPMWSGWYLRPGVAVSLALDRTDTSRLPAPYKAYKNGYCEDTKREGYKNPLKRHKLYSSENCISESLMDRVERECGCLSYQTHPSNSTICSAKETLTCEIPFGATIHYDDLMSYSCPKSCDQITYNADVTYADFASMFIQEQAQRDNVTALHNTLRENTLDVRVFFKTLNVYEVNQEPKLTRETVIGTVGGQMGLFLGASILSITEVVEVLLLLMVRAAKQCVQWITARKAVHPECSGETERKSSQSA